QVAFTASAATADGGNWLSISALQGNVTPATPSSLFVTADPAGLASHTYRGTVIITPPGGTTRRIPVTLTLNSSPVLRLTQSGLTFRSVRSAGTSAPQDVLLLTEGPGAAAFTTNAIIPAGQPKWLKISPASGNAGATPATITVSVDPAGLAPGDY